MTNFDRVKQYYSVFNEDERLASSNSGKLEYEMTMKKLMKHLPKNADILDLGGASGAYTFPLAEYGYRMYLADLSDTLIQKAKDKLQARPNENVVSCDVVNALDLSIYQDGQFDVVLLLGPLYHLQGEAERQRCIQEVGRVLKPGGMVFASFIPWLAGSIAIVDRYCWDPNQVDAANLREVFSSGRFNNNSSRGFQEGYYPTSDEIANLFAQNCFEKISISSIRGFAYEREDRLYAIQDQEMFEQIIRLAEETAKLKEIVETCGHAMYIGRKGE